MTTETNPTGKTLDIKMFQNLASRPAQAIDMDDPSENSETDDQQQQQMNPQLQNQNQQ